MGANVCVACACARAFICLCACLSVCLPCVGVLCDAKLLLWTQGMGGVIVASDALCSSCLLLSVSVTVGRQEHA